MGIKELIDEANALADALYETAREIREQGGTMRLSLTDEWGKTIAYIVMDGSEDKLFRATSLVE